MLERWPPSFAITVVILFWKPSTTFCSCCSIIVLIEFSMAIFNWSMLLWLASSHFLWTVFTFPSLLCIANTRKIRSSWVYFGIFVKKKFLQKSKLTCFANMAPRSMKQKKFSFYLGACLRNSTFFPIISYGPLGTYVLLNHLTFSTLHETQY